MKKDRVQKAFFEELRKTPIVHFACKRVGISRQSIYRWKNEDPKFANQMRQAMRDGEEYINDMTESQLITLIQEKKWPAMKYWLDKRHRKYRPVRSEEDLLKENRVFSDETMKRVKAMQDRWNKKPKKGVKRTDMKKKVHRKTIDENKVTKRNEKDIKPPPIFC